MAKKKKKQPIQTAEAKAHPWRPCPLGQHWVRAHPRNRVSSKGKPYIQQMPGTCREGRSHLDHMYPDEIHEVAAQNFSKLTGPPSDNSLDFGSSGTEYDSLIRGWTRYWNELLKPSDPLDPDVVKALIASESGFNEKKWNRRRGTNAAYGLMQVTSKSVQLLKDAKELRDHFVDVTNEEMKDPNLSICAGIRWLFRKKELEERKKSKAISWREAIRCYKGYDAKDKTQKGMEIFDSFLKRLKRK